VQKCRLSLLERRAEFAHGLPDCGVPASDRNIVRAEPVQQFVSEYMSEEWLERNPVPLIRIQNNSGDRREIFRNFASCTFFNITRLLPFSATTVRRLAG